METASKIRQTHHLPEQGKRYRNHQETKIKSRTPKFGGNGFLNHRFIPLINAQQEEIRNNRAIEGNFFRSLTNLAETYSFAPLDVSEKIYPDNIRSAFSYAELKLKAANPDLSLIILQDENHQATLATVLPLNLPTTLYYVAIRPVWNLLQDKAKKKLTEVLLSVFAYLYKVVQVPYYRDNSSYLSGTYEMIREWIEEDPEGLDEADYGEQIANFDAASNNGDRLRDILNNPCHLIQFEQRLKKLKPSGEWQRELHKVCMKFLNLYTSYPDRSIFDNIYEGLLYPQEEERIYPEQYLSFFWDYEDNIYQSLFETVNAELQEKSVMDEPLSIQSFAFPQEKETHNLDFEKRLFELIPELNSLL
jgi:hypothetical protein